MVDYTELIDEIFLTFVKFFDIITFRFGLVVVFRVDEFYFVAWFEWDKYYICIKYEIKFKNIKDQKKTI